MKNEWESGYTKTPTTVSVQNISFIFFIGRTFSTEKIGKNLFFLLSKRGSR